MANVVIPVCEVCGKQGAVEVDQNVSLQLFLSKAGNRRNGFRYGALIGGEWCIYCDVCEKESDRLKDSQENERNQFILGNRNPTE